MTNLALTAQPSTASVLIQLTGVPGDLTNLLANPSFEVDTAGWSASGTGTTFVRSTAQAQSGAASGLITTGTGATSGASVLHSTGIVPGTTYAARMRVRPGAISDVRMTMQWLTAADVVISSPDGGVVPALPVGVWATVSMTSQAPPTAAKLRVYLQRVNSSTAGVLVYLDAALVRSMLPDETFDPSYYYTGTIPSFFTLTRSDANGVAPVRLRDGQGPIGGVLTVTDYEAALIGSVVYDVVDTQQVRTTASVNLGAVVSTPQITGVQEPQLSVSPESVTGYESTRESGSAVIRVLRRADPVVLLAPTRTREGVLEVWCRDYAAAHAAETVLAESRILLLRQETHPGMDMFFLARSTTFRPLQRTREGWRWQVSTRYVEVRNPNLPLLGGAGWTFDDLVTLYPTFGTVRSTYPTFAALTVGP